MSTCRNTGGCYSYISSTSVDVASAEAAAASAATADSGLCLLHCCRQYCNTALISTLGIRQS